MTGAGLVVVVLHDGNGQCTGGSMMMVAGAGIAVVVLYDGTVGVVVVVWWWWLVLG